MAKGRTDSSGDFTEGANLSADQIDTIISFLKIRNSDPYKTLEEMKYLIGDSEIGQQGIGELSNITDTLLSKDISNLSFKIDPSVVRGLANPLTTLGSILNERLDMSFESKVSVMLLNSPIPCCPISESPIRYFISSKVL